MSKQTLIRVTNPETAEIEIILDGQARKCRLVAGAFRALSNEKRLKLGQLMVGLQDDFMNIVPGLIKHALKLSSHDVDQQTVDKFFDSLTMAEFAVVSEAIGLAISGNAVAPESQKEEAPAQT